MPCTAGVKVKTDLDGSVIELAGIDSDSRSVDLTFDNRSHNLIVSPNTLYAFEEEAVVFEEVPFDYPYKQ